MSGRGRGRGRGRSEGRLPTPGDAQVTSPASGLSNAFPTHGANNVSVLSGGGHDHGQGRGREAVAQSSVTGRAPGRGRGRGRSSGTGFWIPKAPMPVVNAHGGTNTTNNAGAAGGHALISTPISSPASAPGPDCPASTAQASASSAVTAAMADLNSTSSSRSAQLTTSLSQFSQGSTSAGRQAGPEPLAASSSSLAGAAIHRSRSKTDGREHKVEARAGTGLFCPARGVQQVLSQLTKQASQAASLPPKHVPGQNSLSRASLAAEGAASTAGAAASAPATAQTLRATPLYGSSAANDIVTSSQDWRVIPLQSNSSAYATSSQGRQTGYVQLRSNGSSSTSSSLRPSAATFAAGEVQNAACNSLGSTSFVATHAGSGFGARFGAGFGTSISNSRFDAGSGTSNSSSKHGNLSVHASAFTPGLLAGSSTSSSGFGVGSRSRGLSVAAAALEPSTDGGNSTSSKRPGSLIIDAPAFHLKSQQAQRQQQQPAAPPQQPPLQQQHGQQDAAAAAAAALRVAAMGDLNTVVPGRGRGRGAAEVGRGRGRGRAAATAAVSGGGRGSSSSSGGGPALQVAVAAAGPGGRNGRAARNGRGTSEAAVDWRSPHQTAAAAAAAAATGTVAGSSSGGGRVAGSSSSRGRGRGRGTDMSRYAYAGSRIESWADDSTPGAPPTAADDSFGAFSIGPGTAPAAAAALPAALDDSFSASPASCNAAPAAAAAAAYDRLPADEDARSGAATSRAAAKQQQQGNRQVAVNVSATAAADATDKVLAAPTQAAAAAAAAVDQEPVEKLTCVVCLEHPSAVAVGPCDHHQLCASCCLRLRLCYKDNRCPLCKTEAKQVVIVAAPKLAQLIPSYSSLISQKGTFCQKPRWAPGVLTRPTDMLPSPHSRSGLAPVHVRLMQMTAVACPICDKAGQHPLQSMQALQEHLHSAHKGLQMCPTCVKAKRKFPLELETFTPQGLSDHNAAAHKHCEFCDLWFYAVDEMWAHMNQQHFLCSICQAAGIPHLYFKDSAGLRDHYSAKHFPCTEGECGDSGMVAFATEQELRDHQVERHSSKMPRFKKSNARQLLLDLPAIIPRHASRNMSWREQQQNEGRLLAAAGSSSNAGATDDSSSSRGGSRGRGGRGSYQQQQQLHGGNSANNPLTAAEEWPSVEAAAVAAASSAAAAAGTASGPGLDKSASSRYTPQQSSSSSQPAAAAAGGDNASSSSTRQSKSTSISSRGVATDRGAAAETASLAAASTSSSTTDSRHTNRQAPAAAAAAAADPYAHVTSIGEGGMQIIDDDVGMHYDFSQQQQQQEQPQQQQQLEQQWPTPSGDVPIFATNTTSSSNSRPSALGGSSSAAEDFPDLSAAAGASIGKAAADNSKAAPAGAGAAQLVKATAKCTCGRKQIHCVVRQGQQPASLPCDKECELQQRRSQIADAFGVENAAQHAAYWDKHRTPNYSAQLLQAYKTDPIFIEDLEHQLLDFLSSSKSTRLTLRPMTKPQRALVHEYVEQGFGCVSHSTGVEPNRAIQVFKTHSSGTPTQLLSQAGVLVSQLAIDNMLLQQAATALTLRLVDVAPGANLSHHLREWQGQYHLRTESSGVVLLGFSDPKVHKACSDALAGGIRGIFRVDRGAAAGGGANKGDASSSSSSSSAAMQQRADGNSTAAAGASSQYKQPASTGSRGSSRSPAAGWQTVSSKSKVAAAAEAVQVSLPDPWADEDTPAKAAAPPASQLSNVADDWEALLAEPEVEVPRGPALQLQQSNMWEALQQAE